MISETNLENSWVRGQNVTALKANNLSTEIVSKSKGKLKGIKQIYRQHKGNEKKLGGLALDILYW